MSNAFPQAPSSLVFIPVDTWRTPRLLTCRAELFHLFTSPFPPPPPPPLSLPPWSVFVSFVLPHQYSSVHHLPLPASTGEYPIDHCWLCFSVKFHTPGSTSSFHMLMLCTGAVLRLAVCVFLTLSGGHIVIYWNGLHIYISIYHIVLLPVQSI